MKKIIIMSLIIALAIVGASYAQDNKAAFVIRGEMCVVPAYTPPINCPVDIVGTLKVDVSTSGGMTTEVCHFILPEECQVDKTMIVRDLPCPIAVECDNEIIFAVTYDMLGVATPAGEATIVCRDKKNAVCP